MPSASRAVSSTAGDPHKPMSPTAATTTVWPVTGGGGGGPSVLGPGPGCDGPVGELPQPLPSTKAVAATTAAAREARPNTTLYNYRSAMEGPVGSNRHISDTRLLHRTLSLQY